MKHQKGLAPILIVILITLIIGGLFYYQKKTNSTSLKQTVQPIPTPSNSETISKWNTYTDAKYGYSIDYPSDKFVNCDPEIFNLDTGDSCPTDGVRNFSFKILVNPPVKDYSKSDYPDCFIISQEKINISGVEGIKYFSMQQPKTLEKTCQTMDIAYSPNNHKVNIVLNYKNNTYLISFNNFDGFQSSDKYAIDMKEAISQTLNTFKFTK